MPFARPTLATLIARVRADLRGRLEVDGSLLRRAMIDVVGTVWGGTVHLLYGYLDWLGKQLFSDTAEEASLYRRAKPYGIVPTPATFATGNVTATGTNGTNILAGTILRLDAATSYFVVTGQTIAGGTATLPVKAVLAGSAANVPVGTGLTFETTIPGVLGAATVAAGGIADGFDQQGREQVRARYQLRLQEPPEGGAYQDYEAWALAVAGVTRAWVYPREQGLGTVVVRVVNDDADPIFPDPVLVAAVQAAEDAERPVTAKVIALAPTELAVPFSISIVPDSADTRAAVEAELGDLLRRLAEPGDGAGRGKILLSQINTAIGTAEGVTDYTLIAPAANVVPGLGQLTTVGVITWV